MNNTTIHRGDLIAHLRGRVWLVENGYIPRAHAVLCDPPYFLGSMTKRFGSPTAAPAKYGTDGVFQRQSRGFMGQSWDGFSDVWEYQAWCTEWGRLLLSFVYPGAVMLCFGGTRTYHRLAAGLEDAGWVVADCMQWITAQGFPKSLAIGKAIDQAAGAERKVVGTRPKLDSFGVVNNIYGGGPDHEGEQSITIPATDAARQWEGHGTALAPSYEPILVCRAPWTGTYAGIAQEHGTGAINVDGGRIGTNESWSGNSENAHNNYSAQVFGKFRSQYAKPSNPNGRWPKNLILGCACESDVHRPDCAVAIIGAQSGETGNGYRANSSQSRDNFFGLKNGTVGSRGHNDSGTAARFYFQAKAAKWEREAGLHQRAAVTVNDGRDTPIDTPYQRGETERLNTHPTLKPIRLTEYLAKLILPPALSEPRRLLVPFSGSGSEMIGAQFAGWENVTGFEQSDDYADIAQARIAWWAQFADYDMAKRAYDADHVEQQQRAKETAVGVYQIGLFDKETK